jgi:hypothetical protein
MQDVSKDESKEGSPVKGTNKPKTPASNGDLNIPIKQEIDPEKRKILAKEGLAAIKLYEEKSNNSSVKQLSRILLSNPIPEVRTEAARSLGRLGKGIKALHKAIDSDDYAVRQQAYKSIERIGSRLSMKYFINGTKSSDIDVKISSFRGLGKTRSSYGRDIILRYGVESKEPGVVSAALSGLGYYSRKEDLEIFKRYINAEIPEHQTGAISGLGNSKLSQSLDLLVIALAEYPKLEPEIIVAITQKRSLASTLVLIKILHSSKNENIQLLIQKELYERRAYGKYAIVKTPTATMKKYSKANSEKIAVLSFGDIARIRKTTEKLYRAKMNNQIVEDRYYLLQAVSKDSSRKPLVEGWVFGPKINIINLANPKRSNSKQNKEEVDEISDDDSEDEKYLPAPTPTPSKKDTVKPVDNTKSDTVIPPKDKETKPAPKDNEFLDEDEDE